MNFSIIEFSLENFKIFKDKATFSMSSRKNSHTFSRGEHNLLKTSLIYGPNASGKSTLFQALAIFKNLILKSSNIGSEGLSSLPYFPFLFSDEEKKPIFFEVVFILDKKTFLYNFSFLKDVIVEENLVELLSNDKEKIHLSRKGQEIKLFGSLKDSKDVKEKTRKEVLFLSAASQWNNKLAIEIVGSFSNNLNFLGSPSKNNYNKYTTNLIKDNSENLQKVLAFLKKADFSIEDISVEKVELSELEKSRMFPESKDIPGEFSTISFFHNKYSKDNQIIGKGKINIGQESLGTQKFFSILGPIIDTIENGKVLFIDEFDDNLHPKLTKLILDLFEKNNSNNAQLVLITHDVSLLSDKDIFKEQIWFTEKDRYGSAKLFSLAEFDLRNDTEFEKKYLAGKFGALPFIKEL